MDTAWQVLVIVAVVVPVGALMAVLLSFIVQLFYRKYGTKAEIKVGSEKVSVQSDEPEEALRILNKALEELQSHPRVFLIYGISDKNFAQRLKKDLVACGARVDTADDLRERSDRWNYNRRLNGVISSNQWVIVIYSQESSQGGAFKEELEVVLNNEASRDRTLILPVLYEGGALPPELRDREVAADFQEDYEAGLRTLLSNLGLVSA